MNKKKAFLWFSVSLVIIVAIAVISCWNTRKLVRTSSQVAHTLEVLTRLNALQSHVYEAETSRRGFILTGRERHLERFELALKEIDRNFNSLSRLTQDDQEQPRRLGELKAAIAAKCEHMKRSVALWRQGSDLVQQTELTDRGSDLQESIRSLITQMEEGMKALLLLRTQEANLKTQTSLQVLVAGTLLGIALLALAFNFLHREIQARELAEKVMRKSNRTLRTLSQCNETLVRAPEEPDFIQRICDILVADGGYRLVWAGRALEDQTMDTLAMSGPEAAHRGEEAQPVWATELPAGNPLSTALQTGQLCLQKDLGQDPALAPWRAAAAKLGLAAVVALPLKIQDQPWGVLAIFTQDPEAFDEGEVQLLSELARDLEYGIESLRMRAEHQRAEQALRESEAQYRMLVENMNHGLVMVNQAGLFTYVNPHLCELLGYLPEEMVGRQALDFFDPPNQEIAKSQLAPRMQGAREPYEIEWNKKTGEKIFTLISPMPVFDSAGRFLSSFSVVTDISDRKKAEAEAQQRLLSLSLLIAGIEKLVRMSDPDEMVREMCELVNDAFNPRLVWLGRAEADGRVAPLHWVGATSDYLKEIAVRWDNTPEGRGPAGRSIRTGRPVIFNNLESAADFLPWRAAALRHGYQAAAAFPLMSESRPFASLNVYSDREDFFAPERQELLQALAGIVAAAMENARLNTKVNRHLKQLQALRQVEVAVSGSLDLRITLNVTLDQVIAQMNVDAAAILLLNPYTMTLEFAAGRGFLSNAIMQTRVPLGKGNAGRIALEKTSRYVPDLASVQDQLYRLDLVLAEKFVSYYGVPLVNKGQVKGVMEIFHRRHFDADEEFVGFLEALAGQAAIAIDNATLFDEMQRSHLHLSLAYGATLEGWARALELRDFETKGHSQRVSTQTLRQAKALGVSDSELTHLHRGALLHDIGKIAIPDQVLLKPNPLTPEEWLIMRQHPVYAYELLSPITYLQQALDIPFCHHERWNGRGYPRGLKGEEIPLAARIFAVVDVWDALGSDRPYRRAWSRDRIIKYLREQSGKQFDPRVTTVFLEKILPEIAPSQRIMAEGALAEAKTGREPVRLAVRAKPGRGILQK